MVGVGVGVVVVVVVGVAVVVGVGVVVAVVVVVGVGVGVAVAVVVGVGVAVAVVVGVAVGVGRGMMHEIIKNHAGGKEFFYCRSCKKEAHSLAECESSYIPIVSCTGYVALNVTATETLKRLYQRNEELQNRWAHSVLKAVDEAMKRLRENL